MTEKKPHVVCLGGGYVTIYLLKVLRSSIRQGLIDCTVIDKNNYHTFHGLIAEMLVGKIQPGQIISPARKLFLPANFHNAYIEDVDTKRQIVKTSRTLDGKEYDIHYDHLVVALGSVDNLSCYPGIAEHAIQLKEYWDCFRLRSHILRMLEMAEYEPDREERRRLLTFVIAGGNYAGIEVASELIDYLGVLTRREYPRVDPQEVKVIVVHSGEHVLPELGQRFPGLIEYCEKYLARQGLEVRTKVRMASATPAEVILSNRDVIPTRTLISCTGTAQSPLLDRFDAERDERGRLKTDAYVRLLGHSNLWAAGDCAAVPHPTGGTYPPLAIYAMTAGRHIGKNLLRAIAGKELRPFRFPGLGDACALGGHRGVGHLKGLPLKGLVAWLLWRGIMFYYLPSWDRRVRIVSDWLVSPLIGRDIVSLNTEQRMGISTARYEPGQVIIQQGDTGRDLYVIQEGQVTVEQETEDGVKVLGSLRAGDHFGEQAVFAYVRRTATIRAKTPVKVMVIRREQAMELTRSLRDFGEAATRLPEVKEL